MTPFGILISIVAVLGALVMDHGSVASLFKASSVILVVGGSMGAAMAGFTWAQLRVVPRAARLVLKPRKSPDTPGTVDALLALAKEARSNPLVLEELETDDPFMRKGIQLIVSTSDPERVHELLTAEIDGLRVRHQTATKFFADLAGYSPTFGIIGTVVGLIGVLSQLSSPGKLGPDIASAFTATLWGVMLANAVWLPISNKLRRLTDEEVTYREMLVVGLLTMQLNASTTELRDRLEAFLSPSQRVAASSSAAPVPSEVAA